jgi:hypothetical protein
VDKVDPSMCKDEEEAIKFDDYCGIYVMLYANGVNMWCKVGKFGKPIKFGEFLNVVNLWIHCRPIYIVIMNGVNKKIDQSGLQL